MEEIKNNNNTDAFAELLDISQNKLCASPRDYVKTIIDRLEFSESYYDGAESLAEAEFRKLKKELEKLMLKVCAANETSIFDFATALLVKDEYQLLQLNSLVGINKRERAREIAINEGTEHIRKSMDIYMYNLTVHMTVTLTSRNEAMKMPLHAKMKRLFSEEAYAFLFVMYYDYFISRLFNQDDDKILLEEDIKALRQQMDEMETSYESIMKAVQDCLKENKKLSIELEKTKKQKVTSDSTETKKMLYNKDKEIESLKADIETLETKVSDLKVENSELVELFSELEKERDKIRIECDKLRLEFADCNIEYVEEGSTPESKILLKKFIFVGGHDAVTNKLKEKFPNSRFICSENDKVTSSHLKQSEYVVYLTKYMNHAAYNKIKALSKKNNLKEIHTQASGENAILDVIIDEVLKND